MRCASNASHDRSISNAILTLRIAAPNIQPEDLDVRTNVFGSQKGPTKRGPAQPMTEAPPRPDPTRRLPDPVGQKNGYTPKPALQ